MNSFVDDRHEELAHAIDEQWVTRSAQVSPLMGEYERSSTAVVNAALSPRIVKYLRSLDAELKSGRPFTSHSVSPIQRRSRVC